MALNSVSDRGQVYKLEVDQLIRQTNERLTSLQVGSFTNYCVFILAPAPSGARTLLKLLHLLLLGPEHQRVRGPY